MLYGDLQIFDIIVFAAIAAFIIYRLRSVLGKRTGFQKERTIQKPAEEQKTEQINNIPSLFDNELKFEVIYKKVENFNHKQFLEGAKKAFEIIITSFNNGDKKTLKELVSKEVYLAFEKAISENKNDPTSQFYSLIIEGIQDAKVENNIISISINFISEQMVNNDEGKIIKNKDTWTFEKPVNSSNPKWILTQTQYLSFSKLKLRIKKNEGYSNKPYRDQLGFKTIGYGHLIKNKENKYLKIKYNKKYFEQLFEVDFKKALKEYEHMFNNVKHSKFEKELLIEMIFQLGSRGLLKFKKMLFYLNNDQKYMTCLEMMNSLWYKQTPKRVNDLIKNYIRK